MLKKIIPMLLLFLLLPLEGCFIFGTDAFPKSEPIVAGLYETDTAIENEYYNQIKYIVREISEEEFKGANSMDVIEDATTSKNNKKYYHLEFYFYFIKLDRFEKVIVSNLEYSKSDANYYGEMDFVSEEFELHLSFTFRVHYYLGEYTQSLVIYHEGIYFHLVEDSKGDE